MKKFRMMLPVLAVVFAVGAAVAGDFLPGITAYYKLSSTSCSNNLTTQETNCQVSDNPIYPVCTILVGFDAKPAFLQPDCSDQLRQIN